MLQISRKFLVLPLEQRFFDDPKNEGRYQAKFIRHTHRLKPSRKLQQKQTVHIDLRKEEEKILGEMPTNTRELLQTTTKNMYHISVITNPTDEQIKHFQEFYNVSAKEKGSAKISRYHLQTLKLLRNKGGLIITNIGNELNETLCYRIYVVDGENVLSLYVATTTANRNSEEQKNHLCYVNHYLCWENIKTFRNLGFQTYDFGGVSEVDSNSPSKQSFGGEVVTVYSGYISKSPLSRAVVHIESWRDKRLMK